MMKCGFSKKGWNAVVLALLLFVSGYAAAEKSMTLNLKDADINTVISTVSEMTGKNFIVDPRVKGRVTVISAKPMAADEIYQVFLSVLNVQGFSTVPGKSVIKIVPAVNAKQEAIPLKGGRGDESVTRVIPVQNVAAAQLVPVIRPLLPQEAHMAAYAPTNMLIVSSTAANVEKVVQLIESIDLANESDFELIPLQHASAAEIERILNSMQQAGAANRPGGQGGVSDVRVTADNRTNSVILSGDKAGRLNMKRIIERLDSPLEHSGNTHVVYLHYIKAKDIAAVLNGVGKSITESQGGGEAGKGAPSRTVLDIQPEEGTNSLVINAPPDVFRELQAVIRRLDVRRAQVMVKAVIAEVSTDTASELGIQWAYDGTSQEGPVGLIDFNNTVSSTAAAIEAGEPPSLNGMTLGVGNVLSNGVQFGALIRALGGNANNNILSTPTLVTMDNEEAEITVGQNVPFVTGTYTSTGTGSTPGNPFQTIQREDVGLTLKIKPQINEGDAVRMDISQEVSSLSSSSAGASDLITNKRAVKTTVMVDDGQVLVLGGLIDDKLTESEQKVPLLGDIPLLGWLFRYQSTQKVKRDLMVFLHPRILRDGDQSNAISSSKYNYMRARQMELKDRGVRLMSDEAMPVLPEFEDFLELPPPYEERADEPDMSQPPRVMVTE